MTSLAIEEGKCHVDMAGSAVFSFIDLSHRILSLTLFNPDKNLRMADLTAVPDRMFFMGEDDFRHTCHLGGNIKILLDDQGISQDGDPFEKINRGNLAGCFSLFPINTVAKAALGETGSEGAEIIFFSYPFAAGMAALALPGVLLTKGRRT